MHARTDTRMHTRTKPKLRTLTDEEQEVPVSRAISFHSLMKQSVWMI